MKSQYFTDNIKANQNNPKSNRKLIIELNCRNDFSHRTKSNITIGEEAINAPKDIAEMFNSHFAKLGEHPIYHHLL